MGGYLHPVVWLIVFGVMILVEAATLGLTTIWFAGGALIAFIVALFADNWIIEAAVFLVVSGALLFFTRPIAMKFVENRRTKTNYESLVGKLAKVVEAIDNNNSTGTVTLNGLEWTARTKQDEQVIETGVMVKILEVSGVKLIVERA